MGDACPRHRLPREPHFGGRGGRRRGLGRESRTIAAMRGTTGRAYPVIHRADAPQGEPRGRGGDGARVIPAPKAWSG